ncbi:unnamed protein product [Vitrella brassicaformis CCMP3155]|uniref:SET domain-containing protein n=2 Tax=Vitrella brassicaformis TaxID=1169539 RepID=A0A0G4FLW2_VITBC|nr:unnamed protein product [Vitrella brassicaformis CCMP3155]|eukprot:CEM14552.1 unnamed protein product [Vitrella brassicaformis CCMP3155]
MALLCWISQISGSVSLTRLRRPRWEAKGPVDAFSTHTSAFAPSSVIPRRQPRPRAVSTGQQEGGSDVQTMLSWLREWGAEWHHDVCVMDFDGLRGVGARRPIEGRQTLIKIPLSCCIRVTEGRPSPIPKRIIHPNVWSSLPSIFLQLALVLLYERRKGSRAPHVPYTHLLPQSYHMRAERWPPAVTDALNYPHLVAASHQTNELIDWFLGAHGVMGELFSSREELEWAVDSAVTRAVQITCDDGDSLCLLPLMDILNHSTTHGHGVAIEYSRREEAYVATSLPGSRWEAGEQIWWNYGQKGNDELLSQFGFVEADNRLDTHVIDLSTVTRFAPTTPSVSGQQPASDSEWRTLRWRGGDSNAATIPDALVQTIRRHRSFGGGGGDAGVWGAISEILREELAGVSRRLDALSSIRQRYGDQRTADAVWVASQYLIEKTKLLQAGLRHAEEMVRGRPLLPLPDRPLRASVAAVDSPDHFDKTRSIIRVFG